MPFLRTAPIRIQPYFGYRNHDRLIVTARAMHMREPAFARRGRWQAIRTMLAQFVSHEVPDLPVELELVAPDGARFRHQGLTDREGFVSFDIRLDGAWPYAEHPEWETVTFHWANRDGAQAVDGHILAPGQDTGLAIISDIDDTIIETGITGSFRAVMRNWRRIVMEMPADRFWSPVRMCFTMPWAAPSCLPRIRGTRASISGRRIARSSMSRPAPGTSIPILSPICAGAACHWGRCICAIGA